MTLIDLKSLVSAGEFWSFERIIRRLLLQTLFPHGAAADGAALLVLHTRARPISAPQTCTCVLPISNDSNKMSVLKNEMQKKMLKELFIIITFSPEVSVSVHWSYLRQ